MVEPAAEVLFVLCRSDQDMPVPFVDKVPDVADGDVHAPVPTALDKRRKAVVVLPDVDEPPMIFPAYRFQVVDVFRLKAFVIFARIASAGKFVREIFFEFFDLRHFLSLLYDPVNVVRIVFADEPIKEGVTFHAPVVHDIVVIADFFKHGDAPIRAARLRRFFHCLSTFCNRKKFCRVTEL